VSEMTETLRRHYKSRLQRNFSAAIWTFLACCVFFFISSLML